jgi:nucleoside-diphosphate-sugar epimerase
MTPEALFEPPRLGEVRASHGDPDRARLVLGWMPRRALREGLEACAEAWQTSAPVR